MGWAQRRFRWSARRLGGAICRDHVQYPAFAVCTSEMSVGLQGVLYLTVHNLSQLRMCAVIFSPL